MTDIDQLLDCIGFRDGDTYMQVDMKFYAALLKLKLSERDIEDTFGAYLKANDHEGARPLTRRERWLLRVAIVGIVNDRTS